MQNKIHEHLTINIYYEGAGGGIALSLLSPIAISGKGGGAVLIGRPHFSLALPTPWNTPQSLATTNLKI